MPRSDCSALHGVNQILKKVIVNFPQLLSRTHGYFDRPYYHIF